MVHVHQFIVVDHLEVTFVTSETPNNRPVGSVDLCDSAEMKSVDDIVALVVLLYAVDVTAAGQFTWIWILSSTYSLVVKLGNQQASLAFWNMCQ